jgi:pimeloyl-ACP methyl ester carboxylesterase
MLVELVRSLTADGHRLDGALTVPATDSALHLDLDALLLLHGVAGNFYSGNLFDRLVAEFVEAGVAALRVNTRGHDSVSVVWGKSGPMFQGAAYEIVDQCRFDLAAWLDFLQQRGYRQIGVLGHSLGAIKAIYTQVHAPHACVRRIVACSPPRLSYSAFMNSEAQPRFFESVAAAQEQVERGQSNALIMSKFPTPLWITATGYIDKYGREERYNILNFIDRVTCPILVTYGELELASGGIAFAGMDQAVASRRRDGQSLTVVTIPGADHAYTGAADRLATVIMDWCRS